MKMYEVPVIAIVGIVLALVFMAVVAVCLICDTAINIKNHRIYVKQLKEQELDNKVEEMIESKMNYSGGNESV